MKLPRTVKALGFVSLLTDVSSEMIYPLLPAFLTGVLRAGPAFLGVVEGLAETVASLLKLLAGRLSDQLPRRKPLVVAGYSLSSVVRPLVALAAAPWHVLALRVADRVGKGVRGAPRDAIVADVTPASELGRAYGFHRAMDHAGAMAGPLIAAALLGWGLGLRLVFAWAAVPAVLSLLVLLFGVREATRTSVGAGPAPENARPAPLGRGFRLYLTVLAVFTLGNSSDAFLLLRAQDAGVPLTAIPLLWAFHHSVKAGFSTWAGGLSDRLGRRATILAGWSVYALAYAGFAMASRPLEIFLLFAFYGFFHALTEGPERALVAALAPAEARGRAFGWFHAVTGAMLLPASLLTGVLWQALGSSVALGVGALLAALSAVGLLTLVQEPPRLGSEATA
ncbi:MAG TPA: MFS transporter [Vicinamibacteria bacterium]|nr:MFS transporter [Vicinamibacteria bacterium]